MMHLQHWIQLFIDLLHFPSQSKGQLILECPFGPITSSKIPTKLLPDFCPEIFCSFLGAYWKLLGASCRLPCLWYYLLSPPGSSKSFQEAPRKLQKISGQKLGNNFVGILEEVFRPKGHFEINWPLGCFYVHNTAGKDSKAVVCFGNAYSQLPQPNLLNQSYIVQLSQGM